MGQFHTSMTARQAAIAVLNQFNPRQTEVKTVLSKFLEHTNERAVATDLALGVIRNMLLIDRLLVQIAGVPIDRVEKRLKNIIRTGIYELVFTPDRADYGIVDAAVEQTRIVGGQKKTGFVNAVLRNIARSIAQRNSPLEGADPGKIVPRDLKTGCLFTASILPDTQKQPVEYLSQAFSLPDWLVSAWIQEFGFDEARLICIASNRRPGLYIRPNSLKITPAELLIKLSREHVDCELIEQYQMIKLEHAGPVAALPGFNEGLFVVQDLTASLPAKALSPSPGSLVLDLCSAPGGKTVQMAEIMNDTGTIIATDIDSVRLAKVDQNKKRLGISSINIVQFDEILKTADEFGKFDCILLDVPCSNTGVLSRRPEVRFRISEKAVSDIASIQKNLLETAAKLVKPAGKICYSTCSIQEEENSAIVDKFLKTHPNFICTEKKLTLPSAAEPDCDGGFYTILNAM